MFKRSLCIIKAGGDASADAATIKQVMDTVLMQTRNFGDVVIVASAMKGLTRELTRYHNAVSKGANCSGIFSSISSRITESLFEMEGARKDSERWQGITEALAGLRGLESASWFKGYPVDRQYSYIVHRGELMTTRIIEQFLRTASRREIIHVNMLDHYVTEGGFKDATLVDNSLANLSKLILAPPENDDTQRLFLMQGFIGSMSLDGDDTRVPTTNGLEGSDLTAAQVAHALGVEDLYYLKKHVLHTRDPNRFRDAEIVKEISYTNAREIVGNSGVLHQKTLDVLEDSGIKGILVSTEDFSQRTIIG